MHSAPFASVARPLFRFICVSATNINGKVTRVIWLPFSLIDIRTSETLYKFTLTRLTIVFAIVLKQWIVTVEFKY